MYNIAVVDDNETWCFVMSHFLSQHSYRVSTFTDTHVFLSQAEQFDLALIDFSMPARPYQQEMDGPAVINKLKRSLNNPPLLVLFSAYFPQDLLEQLGTLYPEVDACLSKKVDTTELVHEISRLLATKIQTPQVSNSAPAQVPLHQTQLTKQPANG